MSKAPKKIDRDFVQHIAGSILATRLGLHPDLGAVDDQGLASISDMAVRAAIEADSAIERAEERLAEEAKQAEAEEAEKAKAAKAAEAKPATNAKY